MVSGAARTAVALGAVAAVEAVAIGALLAAQRVRAPEAENRVLAGARLAAASGCFACHGPGGTGHVPNPGATGGEVPAFVGGTPMMYADNDAEIAQYVRSGMPDRRKSDAAYLAARDKAELRMPAYGDRLSADQIGGLVAWIRAVSGVAAPQEGPAQQGFDLAVASNCFGCHGPLGAGGVPDPGSLKGTIPGWTGADFRELARDDAEIREWIVRGSIARLEANPAAWHFLTGEVLQMPAFGSRLTSAQVDSLVALVHALRREPPAAEARPTPAN